MSTPPSSSKTGAVRVRVAPGAVVVLSPHPSGVADLPPLTLLGGSVLRVSPEDADALYQQSKIHHPVTGRIYERPVETWMQVRYGNGNCDGLSEHPHIIHAGGRDAALRKAVAPEPEPAPAPAGAGDREGRLLARVTGTLASPFSFPLS